MFGIMNIGKDKIVKKSITRKYKNARITLLDAKFKKVDGKEVLLDEHNVDKLFSEVNKACDMHSLRYNSALKRVVIADDQKLVDDLLNKESESELKESVFKEEFMDIYEPRYTMNQLYLDEEEKKNIIRILNMKKHEDKLFNKWGFKDSTNNDRAIIFNFFGAPGTGKSMAAEAIGSYLGKKIYSINYANLESKYVGQTPKNIKKAFEKAKEDDAVLVFEEADSFLGKRLTNITQSADYGVNITRSVMLLELEKFSGVVIFTTNLLSNYDEAFKRRILASIEFKMPDENGRKAIYETHIPSKMPLEEGLDSEILAKEFDNVSGADIKDMIFMAALNAVDRIDKENASNVNDEDKEDENKTEEKEDIKLYSELCEEENEAQTEVAVSSSEDDEETAQDDEENTDKSDEKKIEEFFDDNKIVVDAVKEIDDADNDLEESNEEDEPQDEDVEKAENEETEDNISSENEQDINEDEFVTLDDFREAYRTIRNRYK